jgi:hypothetical protein
MSRLNSLVCFGQDDEDVLVEAFVAQLAVERFDEGTLAGSAGAPE